MKPSLAAPIPALLLYSIAIAASPSAAHANARVCLEQEQAYEQIQKSASTVEVNNALLSAAAKGCLPLARQLLDAGASLQARDRLGRMPLARAAKAGHADIVELFLKHGAIVDARNLDGSSALFLAAEDDNRGIVETLIAHGADPNLPGRSGVTPIAAAAYLGNEKLVRLLLERGADPKTVDGSGKGPICYAGGRGFTNVVRLLLDHGVDVNTRYGNNLTALMWAAGHADAAGTNDIKQLMTLLIDAGARLDDQDNRGRSALMTAAALGHTTAVELLLSHGADKTLRDKDGKTAADLAGNEALRAQLSAR